MKHVIGFATTPRQGSLWLLLLLMMTLAPAAWAAPSCSAPNVALTLASVSVPSNPSVGTLLGTPANGAVTFSCSGLTGSATSFALQMSNLQATQLVPAQLPTGTNITTLTYATNVAGIGVQLTMSPGMRSYDTTSGDLPSGTFITGYINASSGSLTVNYTAQLIVTGTVGSGTGAINGLTFGQYAWNANNGNDSQSLGTSLTLSAGTQITATSCTVSAGSQNLTVTLPTLSTTALKGNAATAGRTPFSIGLNCPSSTNVSITMASSNQSTIAGVINPTTGSGYASNIGVQLLDKNFNAVTWGSTQLVGQVAAGAVSIPFYAQYYQTAATNSAGKVAGVVTFTMTYH